MATYTKTGAAAGARRYGDEPFGNSIVRRLRMSANSDGELLEISQTPAAVVATDVIELAHIPAGFTWHDAIAVVSTAAGEAMTFNIGFRYADGVDDATFPESDTVFFSALAANSAVRTRTTNARVLKPLPKPAKLVAIAAGVTLASALEMQIVIMGEQT